MEEEYFLDNDRTHEFIETVDSIADDHEEVEDLLDELEGPFQDLLMDDDWLPELYRNPTPDDYDDKGEMGQSIAQWLLYRRENLVLFSLVIPPGVGTPVHDHLSWGLVGLYQGRQQEDFYQRVDDMDNDIGPAELEKKRSQEQGRGDYYKLIPPEDDIHAVETTSEQPSVSIHLLGTDVGCLRRHSFDVEDNFVEQFQSHYTNVRCEEPLDPEEAFSADGGHHHGHDHDHSH